MKHSAVVLQTDTMNYLDDYIDYLGWEVVFVASRHLILFYFGILEDGRSIGLYLWLIQHMLKRSYLQVRCLENLYSARWERQIFWVDYRRLEALLFLVQS